MKNGIIKIIIATLLFSLNPLFVRGIKLDASTLLWSSMLIALAVIGVAILLTKSTRLGKPHKHVVALGIVTAANNVLYFSAIHYTYVALAVLTHYLAPLLLLVVAPFWIKEKETSKSILAGVVGFFGLGLLLLQSQSSTLRPLGLLLGIGSAVFFAVEIGLKREIRNLEHLPTLSTTFWQMLTVVLLLLPFAKFSQLAALDSKGTVMLALFSLFTVALGVLLINSGMKQIQAHHAGTLSYLEPLGAIVLATIVLHEPLTLLMVGGGVLIIAAGLIDASEYRR